jgi:hypothetical protein
MTSTSAHSAPIAPVPATAVVSGSTVDAPNEGLPARGIRRRRIVTLIAVLIWLGGLVVPFRWVPGVEWALERIGSPTVDAYHGTVVSRPVLIWTTTEREERLEWSPDEALTPGGYSYEEVAGLCAGDGVVDLGDGRRYRLNCPTTLDADRYALVDVYRVASDGVREPVHSDHPVPLITAGSWSPPSIAAASVGPALVLVGIRGGLECLMPDEPLDQAEIAVRCGRSVALSWGFVFVMTLTLWTLTVGCARTLLAPFPRPPRPVPPVVRHVLDDGGAGNDSMPPARTGGR